jgi:thioredoxin 1
MVVHRDHYGDGMAGKIVKLSDADFDEKVKSEPLILVDFWAEWCGPCRVIAPVLEELAGEYTGRLTVGKLNVDENRQVAARFGIRSIPTLVFFRDGARVDQVIGAHPKSTLKGKIEQLINAH